MRLIRTSVVLLVTVVLLAMAVPAAQARAIEKPRPALYSQGAAWLDFAMSWLARLAGGEPPVAAARQKPTIATNTSPGPGPGTGPPVKLPMTGSCIDPNGGRQLPPCNGY
jgi:hypothetical protein